MLVGKRSGEYICSQCRRRQLAAFTNGHGRFVSQTRRLPQQSPSAIRDESEMDRAEEADGMRREVGRMTERLVQMTEESIEQGGRGASKAIDEAGFSEQLRKELEDRFQQSRFKSENAAAFSEVNMPTSAGKGTREMAAARPWSGEEAIGDAALRMLDDASKPMRGPPKIPQPRSPMISVDMRMKKAVERSKGQRLANARDRTSVYALSQDPSLSEREREEMRKILKERFTSGGRPMPSSVQGLAALANERIEDAIGRGQFKNIPKGKGINVERDHNADSPFLDTTEYFMNKMIKKQDIVPPWIEKQQELVRNAAHFRGRLRNDWKRHAARVIASSGGSLQDQVRRAEAYAAAEAALNPKATRREALSEIDAEGKLSQITITETRIPTALQSQPEMKITVSEDLTANAPPLSPPTPSDSPPHPPQESSSSPAPAQSSQATQDPQHSLQPASSPPPPSSDPSPPHPPFRDPAWLSLESAYHTLAIRDLNNLTRSYNLQAPSLAKKPYFSLDRELRACYADIAPQLASAIVERARKPPEKVRVEVVGHRPGGVLEKFSTDRKVRVFDSQRPNYGFKDFWRDLWGS